MVSNCSLPIVRRELRTAARRPATYWIRLSLALLGILTACIFLLSSTVASPASLGGILFRVLAFYTFGLSLLAGLFLTADSISEEKRAGTIGLLFLTDLKGYDVVLGKFMARSLAAFYGLLAVFPALALPLLMGGVTGAEYWRTMIALGNALFFSMTAGILVSTLSRDGHQAVGRTLFLLIVTVIGMPLLYSLGPGLGTTDYFSVTGIALTMLLANPFHPFAMAFETRHALWPEGYLLSLGLSHLAGWSFLGLASYALPRIWQADSGKQTRWKQALGTETMTRRKRADRSLLDRNPIVWLAEGGKALKTIVWVVAGLTVAWTWATVPFFGGHQWLYGVSWGIWPALLLFKVLFAIAACRFFAESRRNAAIELILSTPLTSRDILHGQWVALGRVFLWPSVLLVGGTGVAAFLAATIAMTRNGNADALFELLFGGWTLGYRMLVFAGDMLAAGWVGMWVALVTRRPHLAGGLTILYVIVLPSILLCVPDVIIALVLILVARNALMDDLRAKAGKTLMPIIANPAPR